MNNKHEHDLEVLWDGFDGWVLVRCKDIGCDYMKHLFEGKEIK